MPNERESSKPWEYIIGPHAQRDLKNFSKSKPLREEIVNQIKEISKAPFNGDSKVSDLKGIWGWGLKWENTQYRIAYRIDTDKHRVDIVMIGPRGGFYEKLKQYVNH